MGLGKMEEVEKSWRRLGRIEEGWGRLFSVEDNGWER